MTLLRGSILSEHHSLFAPGNHQELGPLADLLLDLADRVTMPEKKPETCFFLREIAEPPSGETVELHGGITLIRPDCIRLPDGRCFRFILVAISWGVSNGLATLASDSSSLDPLRKPGAVRDAFLVSINDYTGPLPAELIESLSQGKRCRQRS
jgi:hypothetical protein